MSHSSIASARDLDTVMAALFERESANWWAFAMRAILAFVFGVTALVRPEVAGASVARAFGCYAIADGLFTVAAAVRGLRQREHWGAMFWGGVVGLVIGIAAVLWSSIDAETLEALIAGWAIALGVLEIVAAMRLRAGSRGRSTVIALGALSLLFGVVLVTLRFEEAIDMVRWIGGYLVTSAVVLLVVALTIRKGHRSHV